MLYYTTIGKTAYCPYLKMNVTLTGKYQLIGDTNKVSFSYAWCSVTENSRHPVWEQDEELKYLSCPKSGNCDLVNNFNKNVNVKKYGYSF